MPKGAIVRGLLETFIKDELVKRGYSPVYTPHIGRLELYRTSGHFPYYRDAQFPPMYFNAVAGAIDLASTASPAATGREARSSFADCCDLAALQAAEVTARPRPPRSKLEAVASAA